MELINSYMAASYFRNLIQSHDVEEFWVVALNPQCKVITSRMLFRGTVDSCLIHPRDIFRFGMSWNATSLLVAHNHPSGAIEPSQPDIEMSQRLRKAGELVLLPVLDHIIVTARAHYSFADQGWNPSLRSANSAF
ncbi:MAG: JAB domain-containing protein [Oligoflexia bacterium]|nr:JAB domain-containing protein [Oligoflexia bacterium]